jgi:hypothetical protein
MAGSGVRTERLAVANLGHGSHARQPTKGNAQGIAEQFAFQKRWPTAAKPLGWDRRF